MSLLYRFRVNGIRSAKTLLATTADVVGDWMFYNSIVRSNNNQETNLFKYELYLMGFCIVSSVMAGLLVISLYINYFHSTTTNNKRRRSLKFAPFGRCVKTTLGLEMFVEDIPQFVLTILITRELGAITTYAAFNFTTSGLNFLFNFLDMIEIDDDNNNNIEEDEKDDNDYIKV
jgi:hypothetical protein